MKCANHPENEAIGMCLKCGKSICETCIVKDRGELFCAECVIKNSDITVKQEKQPALAAILSFVIPGAGQIYNGQPGKGLFIFFTSCLIIPWIYGIFDGYKTAEKINSGGVSVKQRMGCTVSAIGCMVVTPIIIAILGIMLAIAIPAFIKANESEQHPAQISNPQSQAGFSESPQSETK